MCSINSLLASIELSVQNCCVQETDLFYGNWGLPPPELTRFDLSTGCMLNFHTAGMANGRLYDDEDIIVAAGTSEANISAW